MHNTLFISKLMWTHSHSLMRISTVCYQHFHLFFANLSTHTLNFSVKRPLDIYETIEKIAVRESNHLPKVLNVWYHLPNGLSLIHCAVLLVLDICMWLFILSYLYKCYLLFHRSFSSILISWIRWKRQPIYVSLELINLQTMNHYRNSKLSTFTTCLFVLYVVNNLRRLA